MTDSNVLVLIFFYFVGCIVVMYKDILIFFLQISIKIAGDRTSSQQFILK